MTEQINTTPMEAIVAFRALLAERAFRRTFSIGLGFAEGDRCVVSVGDRGVVVLPWSRETDLSLLTNVPTFWDALAGRFNPEAPLPHHLFLWSGELDVMRALEEALGGAKSMVDLRASEPRSNGRRRRRRK
jgi:hypothetical protein